MKMKFFKCKKCGKVIAILKESACGTFCCGEEMVELHAGTTDGAVEKHVPVLAEKDGWYMVYVGTAAHPMTEEHYIEWVLAEYENRFEVLRLKPGDEPKVMLSSEEKPVAVYAYCNLHGLWRNE